MRNLYPLAAAAAALSGCAEKEYDVPGIIALGLPPGEVSAHVAQARRCGASKFSILPDEPNKILVIGKENSFAARRCFAEAMREQYRRKYPIRAFFEEYVG